MKLSTIILTLLISSCNYHNLDCSPLAKDVKITNNNASPSPISYPLLDNSIRSIDFRNFTYQWHPKWDSTPKKIKEIRLQNGEMEAGVLPNGRIESLGFYLMNIMYNDITGDNAEEAIITLAIDSGGSSIPHVIFIYTLTNGTPKMIWVHETGDRADGGLRNIYIERGELIIEQYNLEKTFIDGEEIQTTGYCCPKTFTRSYYEWDGNSFKKIRDEVLQNEFGNAKILLGL